MSWWWMRWSTSASSGLMTLAMPFLMSLVRMSSKVARMASGRWALPKAIDSSREALGTLNPFFAILASSDRHRSRVADAHVADHVPDPPPVAQARLVPLLVVQLVQVLAD